MRYEVREDVDRYNKPTGQWAIWDTHEGKATARFSEKARAEEIVDKYYAAQFAAESAAE